MPKSAGDQIPGIPARNAVVEESRFRVAAVIAAVFKVAAWIALVAGLIAELWTRAHVANSWREQLAVGGGAVFLAAALAFFAYVLDMLRALVLESRRQGARPV